MTSIPVIETTDLRKSYGLVEAVRGINLSIKPHQITAFLGLNGAGKSTTIKMLLGMTQTKSGVGKVLGRSISDTDSSP